MSIADQSSFEFLPLHRDNHQNFITYLAHNEILCKYSDRFLLFSHRGRYRSTVDWTMFDIKDNINPQNLKLETVSDNNKYFVFSHYITEKKGIAMK
jgi:hypothetical protein